MIRTLLAPISGTDHDRVTLATAFALAVPFAAHVDVLYTRLDPTQPSIGEGVGISVVGQLITTASREWAVRGAAAHSAYDVAIATAKAAGLALQDLPPGRGQASAAWREEVGREDLVMRRACPLADLVVLGHARGAADDLRLTLTLEAALLHGGRPVLMAPRAPTGDIGRTVAVAWNGTAEGAHAVAGAMPFLRRAAAVHVLSVATGRTDPSCADDLVTYLAWHDIAAEAQRIEFGPTRVGAALLGRTAELGCDLLVMGAYGHGRMREMILGGVTQHVLHNADLPILMAH